MKKVHLLLFVFQLAFSQNLSRHVNPMIGTAGTGHTFPGATTPFGMVQLSPDTKIDGSWEGCSGYHYDDKTIYGFSHTHLNGTGCTDFGDIMLMPTMGAVSFNPEEYGSKFSHANEKATAGFYAVKLDKHNIDVQLTASTRVGFHEYKFNKSGTANFILDFNHRDKLLYGDIKIIDNKTIEVLRRSEAWAKDQYIYARIEFEKPLAISKVVANQENRNGFYSGTELKLALSKEVKVGETIKVKVALSPTSYDGARLNMSEIKHWDFNKVKKDTEKLWDQELSKIEITSNDKDKLAVFYTALYHTMMQPNIAQDIDGKYRGRDNQIHQAEGFDYYSVFSLWDTFRAAHPLYTLIDKKRTADFINTFLKQYEQGGRLPVWELASNETDCMIGYHSVSVMADAMAKGIKGFDYEKCFEAAKHSAMLDHLGLDAYKRQGFISIDDEHESVSKTVEYAYDDWCIAQMAQMLNKTEDYHYFMKRSQSWKNIFDWNTGFMRPKKNGGWDKPFDAKEINNNYTEGNSWQYSFFVPQDVYGMIEAYGGKDKFEAKLDEMFNSESKTTGREQVDVTGLIGQYAHGNEPSHHMAYLYNYVGKPEKTKKLVHYILENFYKNAPDGLIGNEDCGQMSAWYVLSSMGIYAVTPGEIGWSTSIPFFDKIKVNFESKQTKTITNNSEDIDLVCFDEDSDDDVVAAVGMLESDIEAIIPVPVIQAERKSFKDKLAISIDFNNLESKNYRGQGVKYRVIDEDNKNPKFEFGNGKLEISKTSRVEAFVISSLESSGPTSNTISATFIKKPNNYTVNHISKYNPQYHAGGDDGLVDGIYGSTNWRKGDWQGYQKQNFEAIIDLQQKTEISNITCDFLQDSRSWIVLPKRITVLVSNDGNSFSQVSDKVIEVNALDNEVFTKKIMLEFPQQKAKFVKIIAENYGKFPKGHQAEPYDGDSFIFIDEIEIGYKSVIYEDLVELVDPPIILFKKNSADFLDKYSITHLDQCVYFMKEKRYSTVEIEIRGHADSQENNPKKLSKERAKAFSDYLIMHGIDKNRITTKSYSDSQPVNGCNERNDCTEEELQQNRRCNFIITKM